MQPRIRRWGAFVPPTKVLVVSLVGLVALGALGPPLQALSAEPVRFAISIQGRKVDPSQQTIRTKQGAALELEFTADEPMELHLHGYDHLLAVQPRAVAVMRVDARTAGRFAIAAHGFGREAGGGRSRNHVVLLYLEVHPR